ncbi:MAG: AAA family ATPase [Verrucomicrobia bacterium]|nr:AAA family ATPase [Verrucomicrobiota bacterium]
MSYPPAQQPPASPPTSHGVDPLPVQRASQLESNGPQTQWLIEELWAEQAVGILGGEPKCCKSFLALDVAVSVASGAACLRQFPVRRRGPVLLFPAEDSLTVVRQRLEGIAAAAQVPFDSLPVQVITAPSLRLDRASDRESLWQTVQQQRPVLLILDPLIRLHRVDENDATQIAALLSYLRELQRQFQLAVLLVHHARKDSNGSRPGQALRGSSELHGWGDSNLYMRRKGSQLTLSTEHRAAPSRDHIPLQLTESGSVVALRVVELSPAEPQVAPTPAERVRQALAQLQKPIAVQQLQKLCGMRTATLCSVLAQLATTGEVIHDARGYQLKLPLPVSRPIDPQGKGNGKRCDFVQ